MNLAAHSLWSERQREWLRALGHDVPVLAVLDSGAADLPPARTADRTIAFPAEEAQAAPTGRNAVVAGAETDDAPLLRALARAAGRSPQDPEFLGVLPDLSTLHGRPAARRALWPTLRALRKKGAG